MDSTSPRIVQLPGSSPARPTLSYRDSKLIVRHPSYQRSLAALAKQLGGRWRVEPQPSESKLRTVSGRWEFPSYICYANAIVEELHGLDKDDAFTAWRDAELVVLPDDDIPPNVRPVWDKLYPFQKEAVTQLVLNPWDHPGCLMALSPGLGKTVVALTAAAILQLPRVLIIAPLSLLNVWNWERQKWFPKRAFSDATKGASIPWPLQVVHGATPPDSGWVVTNYNTVTSPRRVADFCEQAWDLVILDESVSVKNRKTQRFNNIKNLRDSSDLIWLLSGSPITRHPDDLWAQFHLIEPKAFPSYWRFTKRFCNLEHSAYGTKIAGSSGRDFHRDFPDILFVRSQEEVLPDLPEIRFETLNVNMTNAQQRIYDQMLKEFIALLESGEEMTANVKLAQLIRLQQITSNPTNFGPKWPDSSGKHEILAELVETEAVEFPLLIWTHWKRGSQALKDKLEATAPHLRVEQIHGGMDLELEVNPTFDDYKAGKVDILVLSLGVGKFGHTLINTKTAVYLDKTWMADDYVQSIRRIKRIGLTHSPRCISLICPMSIDDMIEDNLAGKMHSISEITNSDLASMLKSLNRSGYGAGLRMPDFAQDWDADDDDE